MSIDRSELHDSTRKAFGEEGLNAARDEGWARAAEMGFMMMPVPEDMDGLGLGREHMAAIHYELGRVLSPLPLAAALMSLEAVIEAEDMQGRAEWIETISMGEVVTAALLSSDVTGGDTLSGSLRGVPDADMAGHVLVVTNDVCALVALDADGVDASERTMWDETRKLFDITLSNVTPAAIVARGDKAKAISQRLAFSLLFALAADSIGGAEAALERSVEYLKTRRQFDRPLAMFQALKHRCADMKMMIAAAEALLWERAVDDKLTLADAGALKMLASEVYLHVTEEMIQLHGGIGLTEEHEAHLFMKRAMLNAQLGGNGDRWAETAGRAAVAELTA